MKIAICDDNKESRNDIIAILQSCGAYIPDMTITEFADGTNLVACYEKDQAFDLLLLDVEMPGIDGIAAGKRIREIDKAVIIVYLTSHKQYVFKSMSIEVFDYLLKPPDIAAVREMLDRAYRKFKEQHYIVTFKYEGSSYSLEVGDIVYIEGYARYIHFCTSRNENYRCIGKMNDYEKRLAPYGFLRCHQGYLINMKYISCIDKQKILTTAGHSIDMSVRKRHECLRAYNKYLTRHEI